MKQIIYEIKSFFLLLIITGGISACADDLGNYDYQNLPEVKINGLGSSVTTLAYRNLSIPIILEGQQTPENQYEYEWKTIRQFKVENANDPDTEILSTSKDLDVNISLRPGLYKLIYTVKDNKLNVFYQQQANLSVITTTSEGWVVLCSENGNVRLDMISTVSGEIVHSKDLLADSDIPFKKGPRALIALSPEGRDDMSTVRQVDPISPFYLLTDEGTTRLHRDAFEWKEEFLMKYEMGNLRDPKPSHIACAGYFRMMTSDSDVFYSDYGSGVGLWGSSLNYLRKEDNSRKPIRVAPYVGCNITNPMSYAPSYMFYDLDHKRFVYHPGGVFGEIVQDPTIGCLNMTDAEAGGNSFSFPTGYEYIYMENSGRHYSESPLMPGLFDNITYTILEKEGAYHLYGISLNDNYLAMMGMGFPYVKTHYVNLANCQGITQASHFAFSPLNDQMFYATGGKVYRVNLDTKNPSGDFQFEVPGEITHLKFYLYMNPENAARSYDLIVGSDTGGAEGGELRIYDASNNLEQTTNYKEIHTGFARIVDVIYKEPLTQK